MDETLDLDAIERIAGYAEEPVKHTTQALVARVRAAEAEVARLRERLADLALTGEKVTGIWVDLTSQEMYGEAIDCAIGNHDTPDRVEFEEAVQSLRTALAEARK